MNKISGVYKITNNITGDFYIGSSVHVKRRWAAHKSPSSWIYYSNLKLYKAFIEYGLDNFKFDIIEKTDNLKEREQYWIEQLNPTYNDRRANGLDIDKYRENNIKLTKEWYKDHQEERLAYSKEYYNAHQEEILAKHKAYYETNREEYLAKCKEYRDKLCLYNNEILTLHALSARFRRHGIPHPTQEARKYLIEA